MTKIKLDKNNFNLHTEAGMELLEKSIQEVGVIESVTIDKDGEIITGNARQITFEKLGYKPKFIKLEENEYPVIETELEGEKRIRAAIMANTVSQANINLDLEKIQEIAVEQHNIDIEEIGVEIFDIAGDSDLFAAGTKEPEKFNGIEFILGSFRIKIGKKDPLYPLFEKLVENLQLPVDRPELQKKLIKICESVF